MSTLGRRLAIGVVAVVGVGLAYGAGVITGVVGSNHQEGVIDAAADRIESQAAQPIDREQLERAAVEGMLKALGDRWSSYYGPTQYSSFQDALEGRYSGVGLWVHTGVHGVVAGSVQPGSPSALAGLQSGDRIVAVDDWQVDGASVGEVIQRLRGSDGSDVQVTVERDGVPYTYTMTRSLVTTENAVIDRLEGGVTRIEIRTFTRGVARDIRQALSHDADAYSAGIVLDLRGNPGGLLDEAVDVASIFLDGGTVVSYEQRDAPDKVLDAVGHGDTSTPVVVLVDGGTASAAEVVAAALQDRNRAVIVGSQTYGKGSVQEPIQLPDGSAIEFTIGRYLTPNGRVIDGKGVEPDVLVDPDSPPEIAEQRALEVLHGLTAALPASSDLG